MPGSGTAAAGGPTHVWHDSLQQHVVANLDKRRSNLLGASTSPYNAALLRAVHARPEQRARFLKVFRVMGRAVGRAIFNGRHILGEHGTMGCHAWRVAPRLWCSTSCNLVGSFGASEAGRARRDGAHGALGGALSELTCIGWTQAPGPATHALLAVSTASDCSRWQGHRHCDGWLVCGRMRHRTGVGPATSGPYTSHDET